MFAVGIVALHRGLAACGSPGTSPSLDIARALQGVGGAALFATALALIGAEYQGRERGRRHRDLGSTVGIAVAAGPLSAASSRNGSSWRWIFFVNIPIGVAVFVIAM